MLVSIARRLQDPLSEYLRVSPEHLGVGWYQHDIPVIHLQSSLNEVVTECISEIGIDINSCTLRVLRYNIYNSDLDIS